jgi:hypothetical protein
VCCCLVCCTSCTPLLSIELIVDVTSITM